MKTTVLIVDDIDVNRIILREILSEDYTILEASGGEEAVALVCDTFNLPDIILLDIMMPDMDGYEVLKFLKQNEYTKHIPVLFITSADAGTNESKALNAGSVDFISKPFNSDVVKARVKLHVQIKNYNQHLAKLVSEKTDEISHMQQRILETLATIVEYRSLESGQHIQRVKQMSKILINVMLTKPQYRALLISENYPDIVRATILHDVGKVGVPDRILLKPGRLTDEEYDVMKTHSEIGGSIVDSISKDVPKENLFIRHLKEIAMYHHERWDGKGYPRGLKETEIPVAARIVAIIDVYDAIMSKRVYKDAFPKEKCVEIIKEGRGSQFDPGIVDCFLEAVSDFENVIEAFGEPVQKD
jgi:putative two-component system response regulator